jgi:NAD(P)-dependent dehydrogenase (short-subunit alcohol dehydrogenase family)
MGGRLDGKVVVITGASRGMGSAMAARFAAEGAEVAMLARRASELEAAAAGIGARATPLVCDIADPDAVRSAFARVKARFGGIDVLINNAALANPDPIEEAKDAAVQLEVAVNILGPLYCCREAIPLLRTRGGGDIINISSESVSHPYPHLTLYAATKAALEAFSKGLRKELADDHIRVTVYRSGNVHGTFSRDWAPEARLRARTAARDSGFYTQSGPAIPPEIPAEMLVNLVLLPREAQVDLIELRGAQPTRETIAARAAADPATV